MVQIPWSTLNEFKQEAERLLGECLGRGAARLPLWDLIERPQEFVILAEMPGVEAESIDLRLTGSTLTIRAEKRQEPPEVDEIYHVAERSYGPLSRTLTLPGAIDAAGVRAEYHHGILRVKLPKTPESEAHKINVEQL